MTTPLPVHAISPKLDALAGEIYEALAGRFPVCLASDEFHFFPQYKAQGSVQASWDDFSDRSVQSLITAVAQWRDRLDTLRPPPMETTAAVNIDLLARVLTILEEQLGRVRFQKTQPTFYLTILSIGLAESLDESYDAFGQRIKSLPAFLDSAISNLEDVPAVYKDLALEMLPKLTSWMALLPLTGGEQQSVMSALKRYREHLEGQEGVADFRLTEDLYARIADVHMGCQMGLEEIGDHLEEEIENTAHQLDLSAGQIAPGKAWLEVFHQLPPPEAGDNDAAALFKAGIAQLRNHCLENGFVPEAAIVGCEVKIETIPEHMTPIRANAAYSMPPGHPPKGGVFYLQPLSRQAVPRDMMMLAAHETYPGHHLLDTLRWRQEQPLRRCLEFPIFYEGWASFSEEILFDTEYFSGPVDSLLMAKRRFWRAHRGRAEFRIHTGRSTLGEAAAELSDIGLVSPAQALSMVRRYALKPGYQLAYAIGRRKFRQLYTAYLGGGRTPAQFVREALSEGEIGFDHMAEHMLYSK